MILQSDGTGDIGPLADIDKQGVRTDIEWLQAAETAPRLDLRHGSGRELADGRGQGFNVLRRGPAAASHHIEKSTLGKLFQQIGHLLGRLIILTEVVGEPGIGISANVGVGDLGQLLDVRSQIFGTQGTVQSDGEGTNMRDGVPESFRRLTGEGPATGVGDGT